MASVTVIDTPQTQLKSISQADYSKTKIYSFTKLTKIQEVLPFRVNFTNIGIAPANAGVPGIGLQIIGINNYIL
jgi:hypothetical protein